MSGRGDLLPPGAAACGRSVKKRGCFPALCGPSEKKGGSVFGKGEKVCIFALRKRRDAGSFLKEREREGGPEEIFKKIFWKGGKDFYLCSPAGGKRKTGGARPKGKR